MIQKKERTYSRYCREATLLLAKQIRLGRKERKLTETDLADRIGISRSTLQKIERGDPSCEIGFVFEAAALVGVPLFVAPSTRTHFVSLIENVGNKIALLPASVRKKQNKTDDAF